MIAHSKHHLHAYYVIRNCELAGLTDHEIEIIALIARYHRKSEPKPSHPEFAALGEGDQDAGAHARRHLRVAIGLDRRHHGRVMAVRAEVHAERVVVLAEPDTGRGHRPRAVRRQRAQGVARPRLNRRVELMLS